MDTRTVRAVGAFLIGQRYLLLRFLAASVGRTALVMAGVLLIRDFLFAVLSADAGVGAVLAAWWGRERALAAVGVLLVGSYVGASVLAYHAQVVRQQLVQAVELTLLERLVTHLLRLAVPFFDRVSHGDLVQALRQDVANVRVIVLSATMLLTESVVSAGLLSAAVWISPGLAFWALVVLPMAALPLVVIARRTRARSYAERRAAYVVFDAILQLLRGIRIIRVYQGEATETATTVERTHRFLDEQTRLVRTRELSTVMFESLAGLGIAAVIVVGGVQVMRGDLAWPQLLAFLVAVRSLHGPLDHINVHLMEVQRQWAAAVRLQQLLAERPEVQEAADPLPLRTAPERITFDGVGFSYADAEVLSDLSFEVPAGETLGIAGPSGSGKTTLLSLLARFYDPTAGAIRFDGIDVRRYRLRDLYGQLAIVTQEPFLFATSVRDNIRCGRPGASDGEVEAAARLAEIHDEIVALPDGYDTRVGVGGRGLSGGQAQRVNVARAILKNAPVLLLDEATSSLDSIAETKVQRALDRLQAGRTSFVVAHRLSTLRHAHRILVLDAGRVLGLGTHESLLRECPLYRHMWETQMLGDADRRHGTDDPTGLSATGAGDADIPEWS